MNETNAILFISIFCLANTIFPNTNSISKCTLFLLEVESLQEFLMIIMNKKGNPIQFHGEILHNIIFLLYNPNCYVEFIFWKKKIVNVNAFLKAPVHVSY